MRARCFFIIVLAAGVLPSALGAVAAAGECETSVCIEADSRRAGASCAARSYTALMQIGFAPAREGGSAGGAFPRQETGGQRVADGSLLSYGGGRKGLEHSRAGASTLPRAGTLSSRLHGASGTMLRSRLYRPRTKSATGREAGSADRYGGQRWTAPRK